MPGTTRELTNTSDFPRLTSLDGTEVIPGADSSGAPVAIPSSLFRSASEGDAADASNEARFSSIESDISALENSQALNRIEVATWADLSAITGTIDGQGAEVLSGDSGSHSAATATGYDGASVSNSGRYSWNETWARWVRIGSTGIEGNLEAFYIKEQDTLVNDQYDERFSMFNLANLVATNLTDAATPSYTATKVGTGLQIALSTGSRNIVWSTENKIGANKTRVKYTGVISTGTTGACGVSIYNGVDRTTFQFYGYIGRLSVIGTADTTGIVADGIGPLAATMTVEMDFVFDAATNSATMQMSLDGGAPYSFKFTGIAIGDLYLHQRNAATVTHSFEIAALGQFTSDSFNALVPEVSQAERNAINAAAGLLATMERQPPTGWDYTIPNGYKFYQTGGAYWSSIDLQPILDEDDPEVMVLHVDIAAGSDSNAGTAAAPLKSLNVAAGRIGSGGKAIIKAKGGLYPYANCLRGALGGSIVQIVSWDGEPIVSSMHDDTLSWALDTGTTYVATQAVGNFSTVFDASDLTADGDHGALTLAADLATCRATPGTWYSTGTSRYVNLHDGRAPDSDLRCYTRLVGGASDIYGINQTTNGQTLYMEDLHLEGGDNPYATRLATTTHTLTCFAKRCTVKYGANNGSNITSDGLQVWQDCIAAWNGEDGFNYKSSPFGGLGPLAIEIDCIGRWNGRDNEGTNNGSTTHGGYAIRVNGVYHDNQDRNVHDIDANGVQSLSWNLGCEARDPQTSDANFAAGIIGGSDTALMWLDGCVSNGGAFDIQANAGSTVYTSGFAGDATNQTNNSGTISEYTA